MANEKVKVVFNTPSSNLDRTMYIRLGQVAINLDADATTQLLGQIDDAVLAKYKSNVELERRMQIDIEKLRKFRNEVLNIFYFEFGGAYVQNSNKDIDTERLSVALNALSDFIGFEIGGGGCVD